MKRFLTTLRMCWRHRDVFADAWRESWDHIRHKTDEAMGFKIFNWYPGHITPEQMSRLRMARKRRG